MDSELCLCAPGRSGASTAFSSQVCFKFNYEHERMGRFLPILSFLLSLSQSPNYIAVLTVILQVTIQGCTLTNQNILYVL